MPGQVKVGFVGTGGIATGFHMPALKDIEGVEIAAVCDVDRDRAQAAADKFGGKVYGDHRELIEKAELDALFVCLPPFAHTDAELRAAAKGVHLFVEKPIVMEMKKGLEIAEAIKQAGIISCVGYQVRYMPVSSALRDFLKDKTVAMVAGNRWGGVPGDENHWWRVMEKSGGMLHEMATHNVDFMRYIAGDIASVSARYSLKALVGVKNLTVPDSQVALLEFKNGATGYFAASCALTQGGGWSSTDFILKDMMIRTNFSQITVSPEGAAEIPVPEESTSIQHAFIHAIRTGHRAAIRSDYWDALKTTEVTLGANESAKTGKAVGMKLV
ncbi:MAG: Gfo/Idh/MocA family protein [Armatimonadota bacterium]